jgi:hypothetical protein
MKNKHSEKRKTNRREFLFSVSTGIAVSGILARGNSVVSAAPPLAAVLVRQNVADLNPNGPEINALRAGVAAMKALPANDFKNWQRQAQIHQDFCPHRNWFFLPWHRAYLYYFEQICRQASGNPDFSLPYWDWTTAPRVPAAFWGSDNTLMDTTRAIGPNDEADSESVGQPVIDDITGTRDFLTFASGVATQQQQPSRTGVLEGIPHNYIHGSFVLGNMETFMSPLDPIFWLHHANVDRLWTVWDQRNPGRTTNDTRWLNFELGTFFNLQGAQVTRKVSELLSTYRLGYRYPNQPETPVNPRALLAVVENAPVAALIEREVGKTATTRQPASAKLGAIPQALTTNIKRITPRTFNIIPNRSTLPMLRLTINVDVPKNTRTSVRVFLNAPATSVNTPIDDPSYVGTLFFFEGQSGGQTGATSHDGMTMNDGASRQFMLDVSDTIQRLVNNQRLSSLNDIEISFLPVIGGSRSTADTGEAEIKINSFKLESVP